MKKAILLLLLLAATTWVVSAQAQDYDRDSDSAPTQQATPQPEQSVGHVSLIHGELSMQRGDSGDWVATTLNTPVVRGDTVATGEKSRAEVQLDYANILRLSSASQAKIADLTRTRIQIQLSRGYANFSSFKGSEADVEIDTPNVAVRPLKHGRYRVQVNSDDETEVIVRDGEAQITTPQGSTTIKEGQLMTIRGVDDPQYRVVDAPDRDDWDHFNQNRDKIIQRAEGWRRTNQYYTGVNDLDTYGHWVWIPGYGEVWSPYQNTAWAPYQDGRWVWEPYYGWTWVSYEPWGWAPYHYGRWFLQAGYWYWWPGPVYSYYRPVWAPAYVFFLGFGHHVNFGFGYSSIGWLPCGPHDYFYPWYGRGFNRINVVNVTNINIVNVNHYAIAPLGVRGRQPLISNVNLALTNERVRQAITSVPSENFGRGGFAERQHGVGVAELRQANVVAGNLGVVPTRESLRPAGREAAPGVGGFGGRNTDHFFTRNQPPAGSPSFQEQANRVQDVVRANGGSAQRTMSTDARVGQSPSAVQGSPTRADGAHGGADGLGRFGQSGANGNGQREGSVVASGNPGMEMQKEKGKPVTDSGSSAQQSNSSNRNTVNSGNSSGGWHRFGSGQGPGQTEPNRQINPAGPSSTGGSMNSGRSDRPPNASSNSQPNSQTERIDRGNSGNSGSSGGWQRFPGNGGATTGRDNQGSNSKPPLTIDRPIVTPRNNGNSDRPAFTPRDNGNSNRPSYTPPSRTNSEPPSRMERSMPTPTPHETRTSGGSYRGGGGNYGGGGGSYHSNGGGGSSHSSSGGGGSGRSSGGGGGGSSSHSSGSSSGGGSHSSSGPHGR